MQDKNVCTPLGSNLSNGRNFSEYWRILTDTSLNKEKFFFIHPGLHNESLIYTLPVFKEKEHSCRKYLF